MYGLLPCALYVTEKYPHLYCTVHLFLSIFQYYHLFDMQPPEAVAYGI
jgi:hypothetical protein